MLGLILTIMVKSPPTFQGFPAAALANLIRCLGMGVEWRYLGGGGNLWQSLLLFLLFSGDSLEKTISSNIGETKRSPHHTSRDSPEFLITNPPI